MRVFVLVATWMLCWLAASAQSPFVATADVGSIPAGSTFQVSFTLNNLEGQNFAAPDFRPLRVVSGPMRSFQQTIVNGKGSKKTSYNFTIQAVKEGTYEIPGASIVAGGKTILSNSLKIKVTKANDPATLADLKAGSGFFLRAEIDSSEVYIGEQVVVRYRIYTRINIDNFNIISESPYEACFAQAMDAYKEPVVSTEVNGINYSTKVLRKVALFPQQSGRIEIEPMVLQVGIQKKRRNGFGGFFSSMSYDRKNLTSNGLTLQVQSPYVGAPDNFIGAVGQFKVAQQLSRQRATTDDAVVLAVRFSGNGDVKTIRAPKLTLPPGVESYDPKTTLERMINATDSIRGEKVFEYLLTFKQAGSFEIIPALSYLDPDLGQFITFSDSLTVLVSAGKKKQPSDNNLDVAQENDSWGHYRMEGKVKRQRPPLILRPLYWASFGLPVIAFLVLAWRQKVQERKPEMIIDHTALARERLELAKQHLDAQEPGPFYEEVAFSIKKYLGWRLQFDPSEFSKESVSQSLTAADISASLITQTEEMLNHCDLALYGGGTAPEKMQGTYEQAIDLIAKFEEQF